MSEDKEKTPPKGSVSNPYTEDEYNNMCDTDTWKGGYVEGLGYVGAQTIIYGSGSSSYSDSFYSEDDYSEWSDPFGSWSDPWSEMSHPDNSTGNSGTDENYNSQNNNSSPQSGNTVNCNSYSNLNSQINLQLNGHEEISQYSRNLLKNLKGYKGTIYVTSTCRTPRQQAEAMYYNIVKTSVATQKGIYGKYGDEVIDVYNKSLGMEENIKRMTQKIEELGPSKVSHHCMTRSEYDKKNIMDISANRLSDSNAFIRAIKLQDPEIKVLDERKSNNCIHLEINQPR